MNPKLLTVIQYAQLLYYKTRLYPLISGVHRQLFDRAARGTQLPTFANPEEISPYLRGMIWRPDSWIDFGDSICTPEMVWYRFLNDVAHKIGDCDEFAIFLCAVIAKSIAEGTWTANVVSPHLLSVTWIDAAGRFGGHNVCLLYWSVSEYSSVVPGLWGYQDYDLPKFYGSKENVVAAIRRRYAGPGAQGIGWAIHTPDLKLVEAHRG